MIVKVFSKSTLALTLMDFFTPKHCTQNDGYVARTRRINLHKNLFVSETFMQTVRNGECLVTFKSGRNNALERIVENVHGTFTLTFQNREKNCILKLLSHLDKTKPNLLILRRAPSFL